MPRHPPPNGARRPPCPGARIPRAPPPLEQNRRGGRRDGHRAVRRFDPPVPHCQGQIVDRLAAERGEALDPAHDVEHGVRRPDFVEVHLLRRDPVRSEEHTSELQSQSNLVCRLLLEKKTEMTMNRYMPPDSS